MNKSKFTKGPWKVLNNLSYGDRKYHYQILTKDAGLWVANTEGCDNEEEEANAALIAAAPEMAQCLLDILGEIELDEIPVKDRPASFLKVVEVLGKAGINVMEK